MKKIVFCCSVLSILAFTGCDRGKNSSSPVSSSVDRLTGGSPDSQPAATPAPNCPPTKPPNCKPTPTPPPAGNLTWYADSMPEIVFHEAGVIFFSGFAVDEGSNPPAFEGNLFLLGGAAAGRNEGIMVNQLDPNASRNLSAFSNGKVQFYVRIFQAFDATESLSAKIKDAHGGVGSVTLSPSVGFDSSKIGVWQKVTVPVSMLSGADLKTIQIPWEVDVDAPAGTPNFRLDIDFIQWLH